MRALAAMSQRTVPPIAPGKQIAVLRADHDGAILLARASHAFAALFLELRCLQLLWQPVLEGLWQRTHVSPARIPLRLLLSMIRNFARTGPIGPVNHQSASKSWYPAQRSCTDTNTREP